MRLPRHQTHGFTLVELLVVLLIIGLLALAVGLSIGARSVEDKLDAESLRIERLVQLAADEALASGLDLGLRQTEEGFDFVEPDGSTGGWAVVRHSPFTPRAIQPPFELELLIDGEPVEPVAPAPAIEAQEDQNEASKKAEKILPAVLILSSGEMTPFVMDLFVPEIAVRYRIEGNLLGQLSRLRLEDET